VQPQRLAFRQAFFFNNLTTRPRERRERRRSDRSDREEGAHRNEREARDSYAAAKRDARTPIVRLDKLPLGQSPVRDRTGIAKRSGERCASRSGGEGT
jgi:hypothetical protein